MDAELKAWTLILAAVAVFLFGVVAVVDGRVRLRFHLGWIGLSLWLATLAWDQSDFAFA